MPAPAAVLDLVDRFASHREAYRSGRYNEAQLRREFLDPFLEALGWDVYNRKGYAEAYKEVIHEDAIKVGGHTKAPDYGLRAGGGQRSLFVEAKKPSVDIRDAASPAYQLRRYSWSAKLPVGILTDFEELAVYDCRIRPEKTDRAATARVMYLEFTQYEGRWEELFGMFSPEAIRRGSLEKLVAANKIKKGTAEVDAAFLEEIETWREVLARNIALRNPGIGVRDLNFAVQRIIDRIVFLRICEDRGIEPYGRLRSAANGPEVYRRLAEMFERADERYNSGLFHFTPERDRREPPDEITLALAVDDKPLKEIIQGLYFPDSPYEFSVLPAEILGQVYEQFLGKVVRLTKGGQAKVEEKPEVRKAGGVYYTPAYIVDYIVRQTVGKLLEGRTPKQVERQGLRVLDPACGSGSFLIGAYQYLHDWHRDRYMEDDPEQHARGRRPRVYRSASGVWRLTTAEKKRILLAHISGVDIDPQAVEVTKLSLLLKVLEGESEETLGNQLRLFHERALPDLGGNIKCGNSLVGPDFYEGRQMNLFDPEEVYRINAFDWKAEFPEAFAGQDAGFDAVIGNPPYVRMESFKPIKDYLRGMYEAHEERADLYAYFLERALSLLNPGGVVGMIVSNKFAKAKYGRPLRQVIASRATIKEIADFAGARVFAGATVRTMVLTGKCQTPGDAGFTRYVPVPDCDTLQAMSSGVLSVRDYAARAGYALPPGALGTAGWQFGRQENADILQHMRSGQRLCDWLGARALFGLKTGLNEAFVIDRARRDELVALDPQSECVLKPILFGRDVRRYRLSDGGRYVIYCHPDRSIEQFRAVREHLSPFRKALSERAGTQQWYELQQPAVALIPYLERPKIVYPIIANECRFTIDERGFSINDKLFVLPTADPALLATLNSRLANFYFSAVCAALEGSGDRYLEFRAQYVDAFPVPGRLRDPGAHNELGELGTTMLSLHQRLAAAKTDHDKTVLSRQIEATDRQIDRLVYELYALSAEEIALVEGAANP